MSRLFAKPNAALPTPIATAVLQPADARLDSWAMIVRLTFALIHADLMALARACILGLLFPFTTASTFVRRGSLFGEAVEEPNSRRSFILERPHEIAVDCHSCRMAGSLVGFLLDKLDYNNRYFHLPTLVVWLSPRQPLWIVEALAGPSRHVTK